MASPGQLPPLQLLAPTGTNTDPRDLPEDVQDAIHMALKLGKAGLDKVCEKWSVWCDLNATHSMCIQPNHDSWKQGCKALGWDFDHPPRDVEDREQTWRAFFNCICKGLWELQTIGITPHNPEDFQTAFGWYKAFLHARSNSSWRAWEKRCRGEILDAIETVLTLPRAQRENLANKLAVIEDVVSYGDHDLGPFLRNARDLERWGVSFVDIAYRQQNSKEQALQNLESRLMTGQNPVGIWDALIREWSKYTPYNVPKVYYRGNDVFYKTSAILHRLSNAGILDLNRTIEVEDFVSYPTAERANFSNMLMAVTRIAVGPVQDALCSLVEFFVLNGARVNEELKLSPIPPSGETFNDGEENLKIRFESPLLAYAVFIKHSKLARVLLKSGAKMGAYVRKEFRRSTQSLAPRKSLPSYEREPRVGQTLLDIAMRVKKLPASTDDVHWQHRESFDTADMVNLLLGRNAILAESGSVILDILSKPRDIKSQRGVLQVAEYAQRNPRAVSLRYLDKRVLRALLAWLEFEDALENAKDGI